jgi:hypothetical protein
LILAAGVLTALSMASQAIAVTNGERTAELTLFGKINNKRAAIGKVREREHTFIRGQAETHSNDMAASNSLNHNGFNARVTAIRNNDAGIKNSGDGWICENVAVVSGYSSADQAMATIFSLWMKSDPHRKCMLDQEGHPTQSAAIGIAQKGQTWWATYIAAHDKTPQ